MNDDTTLLEMRGITKRFPGVLALDDVHFSVRPGEVHALVGENGAGKSTLMKILGGAYVADRGEVYLKGKPIDLQSPGDGIRAGLNIVYQELVLAPQLTVAENIMMGQQPRRYGPFVDWHETRKRARDVLQRLGVDLDVRRSVRRLTVAQQQIVEIGRALQRQSHVLVLDEPSAVLDKNDIDILYDVIRRLKARGIAVVYISHRLEEIFLIADRVTVLKDGKVVGTRDIEEIDEVDLVRMMIGRDLSNVFEKAQQSELGRELLRVEGLTQADNFEDVSFSVHAGEIVGIAGLVGSGRTELARVLAGAERPNSGTITVDGKRVTLRSPGDAMAHGIGLLPEDRNQQGLFLKRPLFENVTIANLDDFRRVGLLDLGKERKQVRALMDELDIRATGTGQLVANLSGGNKQKVVLARWLETESKVLIFDEPTRGVDVGAKVEIYRLMNRLAAEGVAIIMISSEMPEVLGMSDRILVMWRGKIAGCFDRDEATREEILEVALLGEKNNAK